MRVGILADILERRGHEVVWWTSTFDHMLKRHVRQESCSEQIRDRYRLEFLHAPGYRRNFSIARLLNHVWLGHKFRRRAAVAQEKPDIVFSSLPSLELAAESARYGKRNGIPVVMDVRDLWPDVFEQYIPSWAKLPSRLAIAPLRHLSHIACSEATAITGITPPFLEWGLKHAGRVPREWDGVYPLARRFSPPSHEALREARAFWREHGVTREAGELVVCFLGTMRAQVDLVDALRAARLLHGRKPKIRFVFCGEGERLPQYRQMSQDLDNVMFPGWMDNARVHSLLEIASVGLAPYRNTPDFMESIPNKPIEYLSAGLPIVSSLRGMLEQLLTERDCGFTYEEGEGRALAEALSSLAQDPAALQRMSNNARQVFEEFFDADRVYGRLADTLENLAAQASAKPASN